MKLWKKGSVYNLIHSIKPYTCEMFLAIISSLLKQVAVLGTVALTSYIVGMVMEQKTPERMAFFVFVLIFCIIMRAICNYGEMWFAHDVAFRVIRDFRLQLYKKISEISPAYTLKEKTGKLGQILIGDVEILELFLAHTFSGFVVAVIITLSVMGVLFFISPILAVLLAVASVLLFLVPIMMKKRAQSQGRDVREKLADTNAAMVESVHGLREIVTLNSEEKFKLKIHKKMDALYSAQEIYGRKKGIETMFTQIICGCFTVLVMLVSAILASKGKLEFALYPVVIMLSTVVLSPVIEAATVAQELGLVFAAANRIQNILAESPVIYDNGKKHCPNAACRIEFDKVSFGYKEQENLVLKEVSFCVEPGETAVLVGHSGAGKTTCANLMLRYWDTNSGSIRINGSDLREYTLESLRESVSAVQQETYLFNTSIRDNIRLGKIEADDEEVIRAANRANAHEFIHGLPERYDTIAGERGYQLSGGQRQRISIARALLKDTPIIIFDEAVSNLDTENEQYIQKMLKTQLKGKTLIMIAHRLSTILSADKVIMLENGRVLDVGKHTELLERCTEYRKLIEHQM